MLGLQIETIIFLNNVLHKISYKASMKVRFITFTHFKIVGFMDIRQNIDIRHHLVKLS